MVWIPLTKQALGPANKRQEDEPTGPPCSQHHTDSCDTHCLTLHSYYILDRYSEAICRLKEWLTLTLEWRPDGERGLLSPSAFTQLCQKGPITPLSLPDGPPRPPCASARLLPVLQKDRHTPLPVMWYGTPAAAAKKSWLFPPPNKRQNCLHTTLICACIQIMSK